MVFTADMANKFFNKTDISDSWPVHSREELWVKFLFQLFYGFAHDLHTVKSVNTHIIVCRINLLYVLYVDTGDFRPILDGQYLRIRICFHWLSVS